MAIRRAMEKAKDDDFRNQHRREAYGSEVDDYMRRLTGKESYYAEQQRTEQERYWADYARNTGIEPRYPIMAGQQWNQPLSGLPMGLTQVPGQMKAIDMLYGGMQ